MSGSTNKPRKEVDADADSAGGTVVRPPGFVWGLGPTRRREWVNLLLEEGAASARVVDPQDAAEQELRAHAAAVLSTVQAGLAPVVEQARESLTVLLGGDVDDVREWVVWVVQQELEHLLAERRRVGP